MAFAPDLSGNRDTVDFASFMVTAVANLGSEKISDLGWYTKDPETGAAVARDKLHSFLHTGARLIRHRGTGMSRSTTALTSAARQVWRRGRFVASSPPPIPVETVSELRCEAESGSK